MTLSHSTKITIGLFIVVVGVVVFVAMKLQKIDDIDQRLTRVENKLDKLFEIKTVYEPTLRK